MTNSAQKEVATPKFCPFCRSKDLRTAAKVINESTYWRCIGCGEIWNPGRLRPAQSPGFGGRW
jgi:ribosomal protein L37AE/L43A